MGSIKKTVCHVGVILILAVYIGSGITQQNLWFDEAYTVALLRHPIGEMCRVAVNDVHPLLYYIMLKLFSYVAGNSILAMRLFSWIPIAGILILGLTHIRPYFGQKVGILFSVLIGILPVTMRYGTQIRMYSWALLFVTLSAFYAYQCFKSENKGRKNWIYMGIYSMAAGYTHYFALLAAVVIQLVLLANILPAGRKNRKPVKILLKEDQIEQTPKIRCWLKAVIVQMIVYIPGLIIFFLQTTKNVIRGFWIQVEYPDILKQLIEFLLKDTIDSNIPFWIGIIVILYVLYMLIQIKKIKKTEAKLAKASFAVPIIVIGMGLFVSIMRPILIPRYCLPMAGIMAFGIALILAADKRKWRSGFVIIAVVILSIWNFKEYREICYSPQNGEAEQFIRQRMEPDDRFFYEDINNGGAIAVLFPEQQQYFYNKQHWSVEEAYEAFGPGMKTVDDLQTIKEMRKESGKGQRVWVIDNDWSNAWEEIERLGYEKKIVDRVKLFHPYSNQCFVISCFLFSAENE